MSFQSNIFYKLHYSIQSVLHIGILFCCLSSFCLPIYAMPTAANSKDSIYLKILGTAQDGGYPQIGCTKACCMAIKQGKETRKNVVSLGLVNKNKYWLFEATPDISDQLDLMQEVLKTKNFQLPEGIFISHAHMGHYTGLQFLGREALGAKQIPVYTMPKMESFLKNNGPWSQLVQLNNISLRPIQHKQPIVLDQQISVTPILVPHRDEFSETIGFMIQSRSKKILFIPDIDKWEKWEEDIVGLIKSVDLALIDGTFFQNGELPNRDMTEVPHPFVEESIKKFSQLSERDKYKICFIHFNHTNPLLKNHSIEKTRLIQMGFRVAEQGLTIPL
jgi:pyrroloquinoline quinone biosynthesis protein B